MSLLAIVSLIAFCAMGYVTMQNMRTSIDTSLTKALDGESQANALPFIGHGGDSGDDTGSAIPAYTVSVTWQGDIYVDKNLAAQMDKDVLAQAVSYAVASCNGQVTQGSLTQYGLYYKVAPKDLGYRIAFVDSSTYSETLKSTLASFAGAWIILMVVLLVITVCLSRYVAHPVDAAWKNQQRFIADASHELKTPLTVILADASILAQNPEKTVEEQKTWVEGISSEAERMRRLTEDLLTLAQADAGTSSEPVMTQIDLSQLAERACLQFEAAAFERGLLIEDNIEEGIEVCGMGDKLDGLLKTLIENACKYGAGSNEPIRVALARAKGSAVLSVHNGGVPIPPEDLPHVFDRFYKSDKSRTGTGESASFGLGLAIAKSTVEAHKGTITVTSGPQGTTFTVTLPLAKH